MGTPYTTANTPHYMYLREEDMKVHRVLREGQLKNYQ